MAFEGSLNGPYLPERMFTNITVSRLLENIKIRKPMIGNSGTYLTKQFLIRPK